MKKLALLLTVATVFAITSCNEKPAEDAATTEATEAVEAVVDTAAAMVDSAATAVNAAAGAVEAVKEEVKK